MTANILLIDDEFDFTELTKTLLGFHDFNVNVVNDPLIVEAEIKKGHYDVVVTDLMMPGIDGFALIKLFREDEKHKLIPIIVLSAKTLTDEERKFLFQNKAHFLTKPFQPQELVDQIKNLLHSNE